LISTGALPRPHWESSKHSPRPLSWIQSPTSKGKEKKKRKEKKQRRKKGRGGEIKKEGEQEGEREIICPPWLKPRSVSPLIYSDS